MLAGDYHPAQWDCISKRHYRSNPSKEKISKRASKGEAMGIDV